MDLKGAQLRKIYDMCAEMTMGGDTKETDLRVNIPYYQRPYKWDVDKINKLIGDFFKYNENDSEQKGYFIKLVGVMPALINIIIRTYINIMEKQGKQEIDIDNFRKFICELREYYEHKNEEFKQIHQYANNIWKLVMLAEDYKIPRDFAKNIMKKINYRQYDTSSIDIVESAKKEAVDQFKNWTNSWRYGSKFHDLKIKIMFTKLYQATKEGTKVKFNFAKFSFSDARKIQLEHLEPEVVDKVNKEKYFQPMDSNVNREDYVNALGNFMLLDQANNTRKDNSPVFFAKKHYEEMGMGEHWLVKEFDNMLKEDKFSKEKNIDQEVIRVPKEEFFIHRRKQLQRYFYAVIDKDLHANESDIKKFDEGDNL